jgi:hypothetical protein
MSSEQKDELKIVIALKGNKASIGAQAPNSDPIFSMVDGDLSVALARVPGLVDEAKRQWETNQRYPKCETPLPSQAQPAPIVRRAPTQAAPAPQPTMF